MDDGTALGPFKKVDNCYRGDSEGEAKDSVTKSAEGEKGDYKV